MNRKDIVNRGIERAGPPRIPVNYCNRDFECSDTIGCGFAPARDFVPPEPGATEWGDAWHVLDKTMGQPATHPLAEWERTDTYTPPDPFAPGRLDGIDDCVEQWGDRFIKFGLGITGFNQATFLRGMEAFLMDLCTDRERAERVLNIVFDFENGLIDQAVQYPVDCIAFGDDWGTQEGLIIDPELWREVFRPRYADQFARCREAGKKVWFHSCGNVHAIIGDLIPPGELVMLVVPIDMEAPKGRLILPQVQTIRDILDNDSYCMIVKEREMREALNRLTSPPALVVTDSQAFLKVAADTPDDVKMTSFSILFARFKGDLPTFVEGAKAIDKLAPGDRVLVAEACSHHPIGEDIGRVKIPRWLTQYVGGKLNFEFVQGHDFPEDISPYKLAIHCGGCTFNRRQLLSRILVCREAKVPMTNYGMAIAYSLGIFERALEPFPEAGGV